MHQFVADVLKVYVPWLENFYRKRGFGPEEIENLIQNVSLRFFKYVQRTNRKTGANPTHPKSAIFRQAQWALGSYLTKKTKLRQREAALEFEPHGSVHHPQGNDRRVRQIITDACKQPKMARDFYLRFIFRWKVATIASLTEEPATTIRDRINRGKKALLFHVGAKLGIAENLLEALYLVDVKNGSITNIAERTGEDLASVRSSIEATRKQVFYWILKK